MSKKLSTRREPTEHEKEFIKEFGKRIAFLRNERGLTLEQCEALGYPSWSHWKQIESGMKSPTLITVMRIAKVLDVPISELLVLL